MTRDDYLQEDLKKEIEEFNERLEQCLSDENFVIEGDGNFDSMYLDGIDDDDNNAGVAANQGITPTEEEYGDMLAQERPEADEEEAVDKYLNAELCLDLGTNNERRGRVCKRLRELDGEPIGRAHPNPLFDTREYEVEFTDGTREKYQANVIAENMYAQVDDEGLQYLLLQEITDHHKGNSAVPISEGTVRSANSTERPKVTTQGWELLVQWKYCSMSWDKRKDLKESNPVEVAEYAVANRIVEEPHLRGGYLIRCASGIGLFLRSRVGIGGRRTSLVLDSHTRLKKH